MWHREMSLTLRGGGTVPMGHALGVALETYPCSHSRKGHVGHPQRQVSWGHPAPVGGLWLQQHMSWGHIPAPMGGRDSAHGMCPQWHVVLGTCPCSRGWKGQCTRSTWLMARIVETCPCSLDVIGQQTRGTSLTPCFAGGRDGALGCHRGHIPVPHRDQTRTWDMSRDSGDPKPYAPPLSRATQPWSSQLQPQAGDIPGGDSQATHLLDD